MAFVSWRSARTNMLRPNRRLALAVMAVSCHLWSSLDDNWAFLVPKEPATGGSGAAFGHSASSLGQQSLMSHNELSLRQIHHTSRQAFELPLGAGYYIANGAIAGGIASTIHSFISAFLVPVVLQLRLHQKRGHTDLDGDLMWFILNHTFLMHLLKFIWFEMLQSACDMLPYSAAVRGLLTGVSYTLVCLPLTNFNHRAARGFSWFFSDFYEGILSTLCRDITYAIVRNYAMIYCFAKLATANAQDPVVVIRAVIVGSVWAAPFQQWRLFILSKEKNVDGDYINYFSRSSILSDVAAAISRGIALAVGYWASPSVAAAVLPYVDKTMLNYGFLSKVVSSGGF